jgi:hypothetical protein
LNWTSNHDPSYCSGSDCYFYFGVCDADVYGGEMNPLHETEASADVLSRTSQCESVPARFPSQYVSVPWEVVKNDGAYVKQPDYATLRIEDTLGGTVLALIVTDIPELKKHAADHARLIAAAPELLAALKAAAAVIGHPEDSFSQHMAQLIAKATGTASTLS